jgi:hypothetical protein
MNPLFALLCACPPAAEPGGISKLLCEGDFSQIQKVIFQRTYNGTVLNTMTPANALLAATWQALVDATDSTKVTWSNTIGDPQNSPGAPISFGSGNQVPGGIPIVKGEEPSTFTSVMYSHTQDIIEEMKAWRCEEASIFLVNELGQIGGLVDNHATPTTFRGIPIVKNTMFVGTKTLGGFGAPDTNAFNWSFGPNWSDKFSIINPSNFDALAGLLPTP